MGAVRPDRLPIQALSAGVSYASRCMPRTEQVTDKGAADAGRDDKAEGQTRSMAANRPYPLFYMMPIDGWLEETKCHQEE